MTHYIPIFADINGRQQRAVCGVWIRQVEHSAEPTCADCARWIHADAAEAAKYGSVEEQAEALFGSPEPDRNAGVVEPLRSIVNRFSATAGYRPKGR